MAGRGGPESFRLHLAELDLSIDFEGARAVADTLAGLLQGWPVAPAGPAAPEPDILVEAAPDGFRITSPWLDEPVTGVSHVAAACSLLIDLALAHLERHPERLCLHGGAVEIGGRLVVLTGPTRAGKSTLVVELARRGHRVWCDDILPLSASADTAFALGMAPRLRLPLPETAPAELRAFVAGHLGPHDERYGYVLPPALAPLGATGKIGAVILLDRRPEGPATVARARIEDALAHLLRQSLAEPRDVAATLARLHDLAADVPVLMLGYSDLGPGAEALQAALRRPPAELAALPLAAPRPPLPPEADGSEEQPAVPPPFAPCRRCPAVAARPVGEALFLHVAETQTVLRLAGPVGPAIWRLLAEPISADEAADIVAAAFPDQPPHLVRRDVEALFAALATAGTIRAA